MIDDKIPGKAGLGQARQGLAQGNLWPAFFQVSTGRHLRTGPRMPVVKQSLTTARQKQIAPPGGIPPWKKPIAIFFLRNHARKKNRTWVYSRKSSPLIKNLSQRPQGPGHFFVVIDIADLAGTFSWCFSE